jgi:hypothetical protein
VLASIVMKGHDQGPDADEEGGEIGAVSGELHGDCADADEPAEQGQQEEDGETSL